MTCRDEGGARRLMCCCSIGYVIFLWNHAGKVCSSLLAPTRGVLFRNCGRTSIRSVQYSTLQHGTVQYIQYSSMHCICLEETLTNECVSIVYECKRLVSICSMFF